MLKIWVFGQDDTWYWDFRDAQGHPVCMCSPRHGDKHYHSKQSCLLSAERFIDYYLSEHLRLQVWICGEFSYDKNCG